MTGASLPSLSKSIEEKRFDTAYYFYGDEDYRKGSALQALIDSAVDRGTRDFNLDQRRTTGLDPAALGTLLAMPPILAERRMIVLRDVGNLKKDTRAVLEQYLRKPAPDVLLVIISPAGEKADAGLLQLATGIEFAPLDESRATSWMMEHARQVHGARLTESAAQLLCSTVGTDLAALAAEIDKSVSYGGPDIDVAAVEAVVGVRYGETLGDLLEAVAQRRASDALRLAARVLAQPKTGLVPIVAALGTQLLGIGAAVALRRTGAPDSVVRSRLWDLLKATSPNTSGPWGESIARWMTTGPLWRDAAIRSGLQAVLATDRAAKDARVGTDEQLLHTLVLELCGDAHRAVA